jgi:hypothetical protein
MSVSLFVFDSSMIVLIQQSYDMKTMGTGAVSPRVEQQKRNSDHSPPSSAEVKTGGAIPLPPIRLHRVVLN